MFPIALQRRPRPALAAVALAGALAVPAGDAVADVVSSTLAIGGTDYAVDWYLPDGDAVGLVTVQHGFSRHCDNLRETGLRLMARGLVGLCVEASMAGGNPALAEALAVTLLSGITTPDGRAIPEHIVVGGHSAGGLFASRVGWKLDSLAPQRLAGAVLFDPVAAGPSLVGNLRAVSASGRRPVLAVTANAGSCNAQNNAYPALRRVHDDAVAAGRDGFVGVQFVDRSTHVDAEGGDTDSAAVRACRQGPPRPPNTEVLRTLAAQWAFDLATGTRDGDAYPGGAYLDGLTGSGQAVEIAP